jgi:isovaleryl-CoA dehydrogenase
MTDEMLPEEIRAVRDSINRFMASEVVPRMDAVEASGVFPRDLVKKCGAAGFYGAVFPEWVGGTGMGFLAAAVISEEMARHDPRFAACNNQQASTCPYTIYAAGTKEQVERFVPGLLAGETIGMFSLTEAGGGSDAAGNMKTTARRDGDVYRLNGAKMFASMSNETDVGVLFAKTDPDAGHRGITAFIVEPKKYPGFEARPIAIMGLSKALRTCAVFLDDFTVSVENRLGAEGEGFAIAMHGLGAGRVTVAAKALGVARACLEEAVRH